MKFRDTLKVDFSDYTPFTPQRDQAIAVSIYTLSASLIAEYFQRRLGKKGEAMPSELLELRQELKALWFDPQKYLSLQDGDRGGIERSLIVYCEDWIDLYALERDGKFHKMRNVIYLSNTLFAKIFLRPIHHEAIRSKMLDDFGHEDSSSSFS